MLFSSYRTCTSKYNFHFNGRYYSTKQGFATYDTKYCLIINGCLKEFFALNISTHCLYYANVLLKTFDEDASCYQNEIICLTNFETNFDPSLNTFINL